MKKNKLIFKLLNNLKLNEKCVAHISSNSMWPLINVNDKILLQKTKVSEIKKFDVIIFYSSELDELLVHRVISINKNMHITLDTKGDNNLHKDNILINKKNFLGKVIGVKSKKIDLNKNNYFWLSAYVENKLFLKIKEKLFYFFYNSRLKSHF